MRCMGIHLKNYWYNASIRKKLLAFLLSMIFCISVFSVYLIFNTYSYVENFNTNTNEYFEVNILQQNNKKNNMLMFKYFDDVRMENLAEFNESVDQFYLALHKVTTNSHSLESYLLIRSIKNAFISYCDESNMAIKKQREGARDYQLHYYNASRINQYLDGYIAQLLELTLREGNTAYSELANEARIMMYISCIILFMFLAFCLVLGSAFSNYLTKPIERLAQTSLQMSQGDLNVQEIAICSNDEVGTLAKAFNTMSSSIRNLVYDLKEKSLIEKKLHKEEVRNIKNKELLKEARFLALQSQINPHFLFNTLNTISRVITFSRTEEAIKLIGALANILRYNMGSSKLYVTLKDELDLIKQYVFIQQYRFGDRLQVDIDCIALDISVVTIPRFTLQPIIENAVIHGIEPKIAGGRLRIKAYLAKDKAIIKIIDNGVGMPKEKIERIMSMKNKEKTGHTNAIGLSNVMNRLAIFCEKKRCFAIKSKPGLGTVVSIIVPITQIKHKEVK